MRGDSVSLANEPDFSLRGSVSFGGAAQKEQANRDVHVRSYICVCVYIPREEKTATRGYPREPHGRREKPHGETRAASSRDS